MEKKLAINSCFSQYVEPKYLVLLSAYRVHCFQEMSSSTSERKLLRSTLSKYATSSNNKPTLHQSVENPLTLTFSSHFKLSKHYDDSAQLQNKMVAIDRMKSIDKLISEIVYNHNHSLAVMNNYVYGCIRRMESKKYNEDDVLQILKKVSLQSKHLAEIILNLKSLTSKSIYRYEAVCLNHLIKETLSLIRYEILEFPVDIQFEPSEGLPWVKVDKMHIQQVILNLACNAIEAMRDANISDPKLTIELGVVQDNENNIEVSLLDNGPGFCYETAEQLFNPAFTTKPYGMGLGLAVTRTIIENHSGQISAGLNNERGACFRFTLPLKSATY